MDYNVIETYNEKKYSAKVVFPEDIQNYLLNGEFNFTVYDLLTNNYVEADSWTDLTANYGLTAPFTTADEQIKNSLINNKGIVVYYLQDDFSLNVVMIPRCKNYQNNVIGFYTSTIHFNAKYNEELINVDFVAKLYPKIIRADNFDKYIPDAEDPILPNNIERPGYNFPDVYPDDRKINHNLIYNTKDQIYVNTTTSAAKYPEVPLYISKMSAYFMAEYSDSFALDLDNAKSCLYNDRTLAEIPIDYSYDATPVVNDIHVIEQDDDAGYWTSVSSYNITQYLYTDKVGRFENKLFFGLSARHEDVWPPIVPPHELYLPDNILFTVEPKYVLSADVDTEYSFDRYPRLLHINWDNGYKEEGLEFATINFEPLESRHNTFLYDQNYENALGYIVGIDYYDEYDNRISTNEYRGELPITASTMTLSTKNLKGPGETLLIDLINRDDINYKKATVNINFGTFIDPALFEIDPTTNNKRIESYPYYIESEAVSALGWRQYNEINDWIKREIGPTPPPEPPEYDAPDQITMSLEPLGKKDNMIEWYNKTDRVLIINMNDVENIENGSERITLNVGEKNRLFIKSGDLIEVTFVIHYNDTGREVSKTVLLNALGPGNLEYYIRLNELVVDLRDEDETSANVTISTKLVLDTIEARKEYIKATYNIDIDKEGSEGWNECGPMTTLWTREYEKFIPKEWDWFSNYVIFTQSELLIDNSYIGVKSISAPAVEVINNSIVESELFVTGDTENTNAITLKTSINSTKTLVDGRVIDYTSSPYQMVTNKYGDPLIIGVQALADKKMHISNLHPEKKLWVQNQNSRIGNTGDEEGNIQELYTDIGEIAPLNQLEINFTGTESVFVDSQQTRTFDAEVQSQYANLSVANFGTLFFKKGTYYFKNFNAETNLTIKIDNLQEGEYVRIYVENDVKISNLSKIDNPNTEMLSFMLYSHNGSIKIEAASQDINNYGVLVSPTGSVELRNSIVWTGAIWAKKVILAGRSEVHSFGN